MDYQGSSNPYVLVDFDGHKKQSSTVSRKLNPIWNKTFEFEVHDTKTMEYEKLEIKVFNDKRMRIGIFESRIYYYDELVDEHKNENPSPSLLKNDIAMAIPMAAVVGVDGKIVEDS
ncbi:hypothetical protein U1Q18_007247 [Sarracenia purpurea var. burkii]